MDTRDIGASRRSTSERTVSRLQSRLSDDDRACTCDVDVPRTVRHHQGVPRLVRCSKRVNKVREEGAGSDSCSKYAALVGHEAERFDMFCLFSGANILRTLRKKSGYRGSIRVGFRTSSGASAQYRNVRFDGTRCGDSMLIIRREGPMNGRSGLTDPSPSGSTGSHVVLTYTSAGLTHKVSKEGRSWEKTLLSSVVEVATKYLHLLTYLGREAGTTPDMRNGHNVVSAATGEPAL